jgi:ParB family chromosome partitioning protein
MMSKPRGGLGRGLGALIPPVAPVNRPDETPASQPTAGGELHIGPFDGPSHVSGYVELPLDAVVVNKFQPRKIFADHALEILAASIKEFGVLQPIVVRHIRDTQTYELIAGERRWRASRLAGCSTVPAIIRASTDELSLVGALIENLHREDLNPLEEAAGFQQLIDDFGMTHAELASQMGKGRATISNSLRLLELPTEAQAAVVEGKISAGHARALLACGSPRRQAVLLEKIITENLSVRDAEKFTKDPGVHKQTSADAARRENTVPQASILEAQNRLSDHLNTTVSVHLGGKRGQITINFATLGDLHRIYDIICQQD